LGLLLSIFWEYLRCYASFLFGLNYRKSVVFRHLIHRKTHRIPRGYHYSIKTALSIYVRRVILDIFKTGKLDEHPGGEMVFYNDGVESWAMDYVQSNGEKDGLNMYLSPSNMYLKLPIYLKVVYLFLQAILALLSLPILCIRPIGIWSLHLTVVHEHVKIMSLLQGKGIRKFYDFFSYEIGSSFLNELLVGKGIRNHFITSPTPLYETYPDCVCDIFLSASPYHMEELEYKKAHPEYPLRFLYTEMRQWPYNEFDEKLEKFMGESAERNKQIGIYVSGVWWRSKEKHQEFADGFFESEFLLLEHMKRFGEQHPEYTLWLFLHPRERRTEAQLEEALAFYYSQFGTVPFKLMDFGKPTKSQFGLCDISISVSSNTTYERLFGGFKSIFTPYKLPTFPMPGNALEQICARDYVSMERMILDYSNMTTEDFFEQTGLKKYHYKFRKFDSEVTA
jgi:hypothetical protein